MFFSAQKLRPFLLVFSVVLMSASTLPLQAQTTATSSPIAFTDSGNGILQAGNGNLYFPTLPFFEECPTNQNQVCSFIYQVTPAGVVSVFYAFQPVDDSAGPTPANADGIEPTALIVGADGNFYGACMAGGPGGFGTIFQITPAGSLTVLQSFGLNTTTIDGVDVGNQPLSLMQGSDGNLYFTNGVGIYGLTPAGSLLTVYTFPTDGSTGISSQGNGSTSLVQASDGNLYMPMMVAPQTAPGTGNQGAIAQLTLGGQLTVIHALAADGSEGYRPMGPLTEGPDGNLYGTTLYSGTTTPFGPGVAFQVSKAGKYTVLHQFSGLVGNRNGALILGGDGNFYGATLEGGNTTSPNCAPAGCGTIYKLTLGGLYTDLHDFTGGVPTSTIVAQNPTVDGAGPTTPLIQTGDGSFYGASIGNPAAVAVVYNATLTPAIPAPITLAFNKTQINIGDSANLSWQVLNAYSQTAQLCGASIVGGSLSAGNWSGQQTGTRVNGIYSGGAVITPTKPGKYTYALTCGGTETQFATLVVLGITPLQIQTTALQQGTVSQPYQSILNVTGGTPPYVWSTGGLPKGLALGPGTGILSGTPLQYGAYTVSFGVQDSSNPPDSTGVQIDLTVISGLTLSPSLPNPVLATPYSQALRTSGGLPPYQWQLVSGKLPDGLNLNTQSGVVSGTATTPGQYSFAISASDSENPKATVQQTVALSIAVAALTISTPETLPLASVGQPYSTSLTATGGVPPYTWSFGTNTHSGFTQPPGLTLSTAGVLSGTPTQFTTYPNKGAVQGSDLFNVTVTDSENPKVSVTDYLELAVNSTLQLTVTSLPTGVVGVHMEVPLTATGGIPPYSWVASSTPDPNEIGIYLDGNVLIYQPLMATTATVNLTVTDSENQPHAYVQVTLPLTILPAPLVTTTTLTSSSSVAGTGQSVTLTATVAMPSGATPSGPVTFFNGITSLGTAALDANGHATLQTSFATPGVYTITAAYSGNGTDAASTSSPLTETVVTPAITSSINPGSLTVQPGSSGQLVITITPTGGYIGTINFSCGTLPAHVSCLFAPPSLTISAGSGPVTDHLTVSTGGLARMMFRPPDAQPRNTTVLATTLWLPGSLATLFGLARRNRRRPAPRLRNLWIIAILCLASAATLTSCATSIDAPAGTYTIPITISVAGGPSQTISATVIVQ
jgi:uncharacterized repeat protein (TIGR03803 family)